MFIPAAPVFSEVLPPDCEPAIFPTVMFIDVFSIVKASDRVDIGWRLGAKDVEGMFEGTGFTFVEGMGLVAALVTVLAADDGPWTILAIRRLSAMDSSM